MSRRLPLTDGWVEVPVSVWKRIVKRIRSQKLLATGTLLGAVYLLWMGAERTTFISSNSLLKLNIAHKRKSSKRRFSKKLLNLILFLQSAAHALLSSRLRNMTITALATSQIAAHMGSGSGQRFATPLFFLLIWVFYYRLKVGERPKLRFQTTYWNTHICEKAKLAQMTFWPVFWAFNRHAQTICCFAISHLEWLVTSPLKFARERIPAVSESADADYCDAHVPQFVDWVVHNEHSYNVFNDASLDRVDITLDQSTPVVLLVHGLGDDRYTPYMKRACRALCSAGWRVGVFSYWRFDFKRLPTDLKNVVDHIKNKNPNAPLCVIGWSAGANVLLRYLGEQGSQAPLACAIAVSGCLDFLQCSKNVDESENSTYRIFLRMQVQKCINRHLRTLMSNTSRATGSPDRALVARIKQARNVVGYERDSITAYMKFHWIMSGKSMENFPSAIGPDVFRQPFWKPHYTRVAEVSANIKVSSLLLTALDDPITNASHVDWEQLMQNKNIISMITQRGGHVAFYSGVTPFGAAYSDMVVERFISSVLDSLAHTKFIVSTVCKALEEVNPRAKLDMKTIARACSFPNLNSL